MSGYFSLKVAMRIQAESLSRSIQMPENSPTERQFVSFDDVCILRLVSAFGPEDTFNISENDDDRFLFWIRFSSAATISTNSNSVESHF